MTRRRAAALGLAAALTLASACREKGRPDPDIRMAISHQPETAPESEPAPAAPGGTEPGGATGGTTGGATRIPNRLEVPEAVRKAYSGIVLDWKDSTNGKEGKLEVPLGGSADLPGSSLSVSADVYLPAFTMSSDMITSSGIEPENPAARIRVAENGKVLFTGWVFKRFPDVHPFSHPRFSLRLDGGVRKTAA
jgi:hypothetical protein